MLKKDLVDMISKDYGMTKRDSNDIVEIVTRSMKKAIIEDGNLNLCGFLVIDKEYKEPKQKRLPNGNICDVAGRYSLHCKFLKQFKREVNSGVLEEQ